MRFPLLLCVGALCVGCASRQPQLPTDPVQLVEQLARAGSNSSFGSLDQNPSPEALQAIMKGTTHADARVRAQCANLLARKKDVTAVNTLKRACADSDYNVRTQAARAYVSLVDNPDVLQFLRAGDTGMLARSSIAGALLQEDPSVMESKEFVDWALGPMEGPLRENLYGWLEAAGHNRCRTVKKAAPTGERARLYQRIRQDALSPAAAPTLRQAALSAYASLESGSALPELTRLLASRKREERALALTAIGRTDSEEGLQALAETALDAQTDSGLRILAVNGLGLYHRNEKARDALIEVLKDPEPELRIQALRSLGCVGDARALPALDELSQRELHEDVVCQMATTRRCLGRKKRCP